MKWNDGTIWETLRLRTIQSPLVSAWNNLTLQKKQKALVIIVTMVFMFLIVGIIQLSEMWKNRISERAQNEPTKKTTLLSERVERDLWVAAEGHNIKALEDADAKAASNKAKLHKEISLLLADTKHIQPLSFEIITSLLFLLLVLCFLLIIIDTRRTNKEILKKKLELEKIKKEIEDLVQTAQRRLQPFTRLPVGYRNNSVIFVNPNRISFIEIRPTGDILGQYFTLSLLNNPNYQPLWIKEDYLSAAEAFEAAKNILGSTEGLLPPSVWPWPEQNDPIDALWADDMIRRDMAVHKYQ